ncbi:MAG: succinate dehydrogenase iron-sulfur subunit, partial [Methylotenera sp.]
DRLENLEAPDRLYRCHNIMNCVDVCPKKLNPSLAIARIKDLKIKEANHSKTLESKAPTKRQIAIKSLHD